MAGNASANDAAHNRHSGCEAHMCVTKLRPLYPFARCFEIKEMIQLPSPPRPQPTLIRLSLGFCKFCFSHTFYRPRSGTTINYDLPSALANRPESLHMTCLICINILQLPQAAASNSYLHCSDSKWHESYFATISFPCSKPPVSICPHHLLSVQRSCKANTYLSQPTTGNRDTVSHAR